MNPEEIKRLNTFVRNNTKSELLKLCQEKNLAMKGTKHDLALRILGIQTRPNIPVVETPTIYITKNESGRYVHKCSNLVFDKMTKKVIGKEDKNGRIQDLRRADIQVCRQYKFQFVMPENLDCPEFPLGKKPVSGEPESSDEEDGLDDLDDCP